MASAGNSFDEAGARRHDVFIRIIKENFLQQAARRHPQAGAWLASWRKAVHAARWQSLADVRKTYPSAEAVTVKSGRTVTVFNACGNKYRLLAAIHYNRKIVFTLRFLTHAEYSKDEWKNDL